jgi:hypothetical protein
MEPPLSDDEDDKGDRRVTNIVLLCFFLAVVGVGVWLANAMVDYRKLDDCMAQRRRNCAPIDVPPRTPQDGSALTDERRSVGVSPVSRSPDAAKGNTNLR